MKTLSCLSKAALTDWVFVDAAKDFSHRISVEKIAATTRLTKKSRFEIRENLPGSNAKRHETFEFVAFTDAFSIGFDSRDESTNLITLRLCVVPYFSAL